MTGFTYNGIHCEQFNVYYIPDASTNWFPESEYEVYDEDVSWKNGGYFYGVAARTRTFTLKCYYEEISIKTREQIRHWLGRTTYGQLIFDDMPFVYWNVRPTRLVTGARYIDTNDTYSGTFTITFTAYEPFGYLTRKFDTAGTTPDGAADYCFLIPESEMPAAPTTSSRSFLVYNPGTEPCGLSITIEASATNPIMFLNTNNSTSCIFSGFPSSGTLIQINGDTGYVQTFASGATTGNNGYAYHDKGIVRLDPNFSYRNVSFISHGQNGTTATIEIPDIIATDEMLGGTITFTGLSGITASVIYVNTAYNQLTCTLSGSGTVPSSGTCTLNKNNAIQILEKNSSGNWVTPTTLSITSIEIDYHPRIL